MTLEVFPFLRAEERQSQADIQSYEQPRRAALRPRPKAPKLAASPDNRRHDGRARREADRVPVTERDHDNFGEASHAVNRAQ